MKKLTRFYLIAKNLPRTDVFTVLKSILSFYVQYLLAKPCKEYSLNTKP